MSKEILLTILNCGIRVAQWKCDVLVQFGTNLDDWILISGGECNTRSQRIKKKKKEKEFALGG